MSYFRATKRTDHLNPIVLEILEKWEAHEQKQKDELVLRSQEAYRLENKDELLTDDIHKNVVIVSVTGKEVNSGQVESTSDTMISTANTASDSDSRPELIITRKKKRGRSELLTNTYERKTCVFK